MDWLISIAIGGLLCAFALFIALSIVNATKSVDMDYDEEEENSGARDHRQRKEKK